jgi:hypothetical protein
MSIITVASLRSTLGVSSSLYNDAYLQDVIDAAEGTLLPLLVQNSLAITAFKLTNNVATFYTRDAHQFVAGQSVVVTGLPSPFTATHTVTGVTTLAFTAALTNADVTVRPSIPNGTATLSGYGAVTLYSGDPNVEKALMIISVEIFQSITAAGGQIEGIDFASTPYRMGRGLLNRCVGLLGSKIDSGVWVG